jgi:hypothetical protein
LRIAALATRTEKAITASHWARVRALSAR